MRAQQFKFPACLFLALVLGAVVAAPARSDEAHPPAAAGGAHGDAHAGDAHSEEVPLDFKTDLALWSGVTFLLFIIVLRTFAWGPMVTGLDNRESRLRQNLADAEAARDKATRLLTDHQKKLDMVQDEVRAILEEARRDAEYTKQNLMSEAQREAEAIKDRAIREIQRSKDQALKELFDKMHSAVADATEHVLGRGLTGDDHQRLIDEAVTQFRPSSLN